MAKPTAKAPKSKAGAPTKSEAATKSGAAAPPKSRTSGQAGPADKQAARAETPKTEALRADTLDPGQSITTNQGLPMGSDQDS